MWLSNTAAQQNPLRSWALTPGIPISLVWRVDWTLEFCTFSKWLRGAARRWALALGVAQHWVSLLFSPAFSPPAVGSSSELRLLICHMGMRGPVGGTILRCESAVALWALLRTGASLCGAAGRWRHR